MEYLIKDILYNFGPLIIVGLVFLSIIMLIRFGSFVKMLGVPKFILGNWHQQFENLQISTDCVYSRIEELLDEKNYPDTDIYRIDLYQKGFLYSQRSYLRVARFGYIFDICAAPFGKDFFVSWWMGKQLNFIQKLLLVIPIVSRVYEKALLKKTYYQIDTEDMFRESIQAVVAQVVSEITRDNPKRRLSDISIAANEMVKEP